MYSVIVPVYNRPAEVEELLASLSRQTARNFEVIIVEDGSTVSCKDVVVKYAADCNATYYYKENEGRSIARNYGMGRARRSFPPPRKPSTSP